MIKLSKRLEAVAEFVQQGSRLADVGTDHGYIPIFLVEHNRVSSALAMDINQGPLQRAKEHIAACGLDQQIHTRQSDGLLNLQDQEADTVVIAGMGGNLTIHILEEGRKKLLPVQTLILEPQSEIARVRQYLEENGWKLTGENMVYEDGKFYPVMKAEKTDEKIRYQQIQREYGPLLLQMKHPVLKQFLDKEELQLKKIETVLQKNCRPDAENITERMEEVAARLQLNRRAMTFLEKGGTNNEV